MEKHYEDLASSETYVKSEHDCLEPLNDKSDETLAQSNSLLTLPVEIVLYIMSFLTLDDPAYRHLRLYANLKLTEKQVKVILWQFYKKSIGKSDNIATLLKAINSKLNTLQPSFCDYDNWLEGCSILKGRVGQLADKFQALHLLLIKNLKARNFREGKSSINKFIKDYLHKIRDLKNETRSGELGVLDQGVLVKELYLIVKELRLKTFWPVIFEVAKHQNFTRFCISSFVLIAVFYFISSAFLGWKLITLNNYTVDKVFEYAVIIIPTFFLLLACLIGFTNFVFINVVYSVSDYKEDVIDFLKVKLKKIYKKTIRFPVLLDSDRYGKNINVFFDQASSYAKLWD